MNYCMYCGIDIPIEQRMCSVCYGDPYYGSDGHYLRMLEEQHRNKQEEEEYYNSLKDEYDRDIW